MFDAVAPSHGAEHFQTILDRLDEALPGDGPLLDRYSAFKQDFVIPPDKLDAVFQAAIDACRERTRAFIDLPEDENFVVEYVTDKSWSGYNWYQGDYQSLIQVNTDLPIYIDRALDLACHEGYPGHHVFNLLLEKNLLREKGWSEFFIYPLFGPRSLIAEGTANFGIDVAFPAAEREHFEREVLFPLADLDPGRVSEYYAVANLVQGLSYAGNEAARGYLDGDLTSEQAIDWLMTYSLMAEPRARQRLSFIDQYRSYVINYNLGQDLVRNRIEGLGGTADDSREALAALRRPALRPTASLPTAMNQRPDFYDEFEASELFCAQCQKATPVRKRLAHRASAGQQVRLPLLRLRQLRRLQDG